MADLGHPFDAWLRNHSLGGGADVQQVIAAAAGNLAQLPDQHRRRFPVVVVLLESPSVVHGDGSFPIPFDQADADLVVAGRIVIAGVVTDASADDAVRLQLVNQGRQLQALLFGDHTGRIEPNQTDGSVIRE